MTTSNARRFDGVILEYEVSGDGPPVALIHLAPHADSYLPLVNQPALAGYELVRYHRRGYMGSSRPGGAMTIPADLGRLLDYLEIRRAHVCGHSYGGLIALPGGWAQAVSDAESKDESTRITAPVLSLVGGRSHPAFVEIEGLLREWFPQLETVRVPGVDHMLHLQRLTLVAAAVANFLVRHPISVQQRTTST